jgi:hypothetical protein
MIGTALMDLMVVVVGAAYTLMDVLKSNRQRIRNLHKP